MTRCSHSRAFTLVEAISTVVIISIVIAVAAPAISTGIGGYASAATRAELGASASTALERIVAELREIPLRTGGPTPAPDINTLSASSITWSTNSSLSLSGTTLSLTKAGAAAHPLLRNVQSFSVTAYDQNGAALAASLSGSACDAIQRLSIAVTVSQGGVSETLRTRVFPRCIMSGASP